MSGRELNIDSFSKAKLWGIVQQQGRVVGVIAQTVVAPNLTDREVRGKLIDLLVTIGAIAKTDPDPVQEPEPAILMPDEPKLVLP